jgi:hypothetical protein
MKYYIITVLLLTNHIFCWKKTIINSYIGFLTNKVLKYKKYSSALKSSEIDEHTDSLRLNKARLRLAEAQGLIPIGASDMNGISLKVI